MYKKKPQTLHTETVRTDSKIAEFRINMLKAVVFLYSNNEISERDSLKNPFKNSIKK